MIKTAKNQLNAFSCAGQPVQLLPRLFLKNPPRRRQSKTRFPEPCVPQSIRTFHSNSEMIMTGITADMAMSIEARIVSERGITVITIHPM